MGKHSVLWKDFGFTNDNGNIGATNIFPDISIGDSIYVEVRGYQSEYFAVAEENINQGTITLPLSCFYDSYIIINPTIRPYINGVENVNGFVTQPNI